MKRAATLTVLTLMLLAIGACAKKKEPTPAEATLTKVGQPAPAFSVTEVGGATFDLAAMRGKVVVVDFFATWCPPCREEMPRLEKDVWQRFEGPRFAMIALGREHTNEELADFGAKNGFTFPIAGDPGRGVYKHYATSFIPRTLVIGPDGTIIFQSFGFEAKDFDAMTATIARAVEALPPVSAAAASR